VRKLLRELKGVPKEDRGAAFRTVVAICFPDEAPVYLTGKVIGKITKTPKGSEGFGYDPIFEPEGMGKVFAEMTAEEKNAISHRGRAFVKVREWLVRRLAAEEKSV
jgi:XTP/dITP diphosphohydrolase